MTGVEVAKVRRYTFLERLLILAIVIGVVIGMGTAFVAVARQNDIRDANRRLTCITRLTADFQAAVGDALAAPPAPNQARLDATHRIAVTARRLHESDRLCQ